MANVIESAAQAAAAAAALRPEVASGPQSANLRGEQVVVVEDPTAMLADALEELTLSHGDEADKEISKRKIKGDRAVKSFAQEQAEKYLEKLPDLDGDKLQEFAKELLAGGGHSPSSLGRLARNFSKDPSHQHAALAFALELAEAEGGSDELKSALTAAIAQLEADSGPAIRAGANVSGVAAQFAAEGLGGIGELRGLYRDLVLDYDSVTDAYGKLMDGRADEDFPSAVSFMLKSLSADLNAGSQSLSSVKLKQIVDDMDKLKSLSTLHERSSGLLGNLQRVYAAGPGRAGAGQLMKELLSAQDRSWQGMEAFSQLPTRLGMGQKPEASIYFMQGFKEVLRQAPLKLFEEDALKRERLLQTVQEAVDLLVDAELEDV